MKKKAVNYFLIFAVLTLWGTISYRVYAAFSEQEEDTPVSVNTPIKKTAEDYTNYKDTTSLMLNYRDPFRVESETKAKEIPVSQLVTSTNTILNTSPRPVMPKPAMNWNFISYGGYIRNSQSKKLLALVTINGREYMMAEGETNAQIKLLKNLKDSIAVSFEGKTHFVAMNAK